MNTINKITESLNSDELTQENQEWLEALQDILNYQGDQRGRDVLRLLQNYLLSKNIDLSEATLNTPYRNTISINDQPSYPSNHELEQELENIIRWNALAMVLKANDKGTGVGGHIATYQSAATMLEVGFNHFFKEFIG